MTDPLPRLLTLPTVATRLDVSVRTVRRLIESRALASVDVGVASEPRWRVSAAEVERFLAARTIRESDA